MHRLLKYSSVISSSIVSKSSSLLNYALKLFAIKMMAGLYRLNSLGLEHGLILSSVAGNLAIASEQLHGKRQKRTAALTSSLFKVNMWQGYDKLVHELLPRVSDFRTPKVKKPSTFSYILRLRQKFTPLVDFEDLISPEMFDSHRGIFMPLSIHFQFKNIFSHYGGKHYLRMLRLPFSFYVKRPLPAFDDLVEFNQGF